MPASQISAKLLGGRRNGRSDKRSQGPLVLSPTQLGEITLEKEVLQALTSAKLEVVIRISQGSRVAHLENSKGEKVGGLDDLTKIYSMRSFVAKEKKQSASIETRANLVRTAYRASLHNAGDESYEQPKLDNSYFVAAKPYRAMLEIVDKHRSAIQSNYGTKDKELQELLNHYVWRLYNAIEYTIADIVAGKKEKGLLDEHAFNEGLPSYFKTKLAIKSLGLTHDVDLARIIFPQDPSKGFSLTVREWMDPAFLAKQGTVLKNSLFLKELFEADGLVRELSQLSDEQWENAEDPRTQRVKKQRFLVVPTTGLDRVLEPLARQNFRGFALPGTAMDQSKDRLANLAAIPIRAYAFSIRMAETITDFYDRFTPKGTIKPFDDKLGNYAKQMQTYLAGGGQCDLLDIICLKKKPEALMAWVHRECKIIPNGDLSKKIIAALGLSAKEMRTPVETPQLPDQIVAVPLVGLADKGWIFEGLGPLGDEVERAACARFEGSTFYGKQKEEKKKRSEAASVLRKPARAFVDHVKKTHSGSLADAMEMYFRGFYNSKMQDAAVGLALAKFDEIEEVNGDTSGSGSSDEESDSDDE